MTDKQKLEIMTAIMGGNLGRARELCEKYDSGRRTSYRDEVLESIKNQYANFKKYTLEGDAEGVFIQAFEIYVKKELSMFFANTELDDETYKILAKVNENSNKHLLEELYDYFLDNECASINSYEDIEEWIGWFCKKERKYESNEI